MLFLKRRINFYETDLMEIMHHSNYLRLFEEARLHWCRDRGVNQWHGRDKEFLLAVTRTEVSHRAPVQFDEEVTLGIQAKSKGARIIFEYILYRASADGKSLGQVSALGKTEHVLVNNQMKPLKIPPQMKNILEKEPWNETLHSSL